MINNLKRCYRDPKTTVHFRWADGFQATPLPSEVLKAERQGSRWPRT